ncbi:MAG: hypothetical protein ABR518_06120, partial [Actinomycetota bacterium]
GSPQYMAPEQADPVRARLVDQRGDIYSAAFILFELLTGRTPANERERSADVSMALSRRDVPAPLSAAIARALSHDPDGRFESAREWRSALLKVVEAGDSIATPAGQPVRPLAPEPSRGTAARVVRPDAASTISAETRSHTAVVPQEHAGAVGRTGTGPTVRTRPDDAPPLPTRPHAVAAAIAGIALMVGVFVPVGTERSLAAISAHLGNLSFGAAVVAAASALILLGTGALLWRVRRRWAGRVVAVAAVLAGLAAMAVAAWAAVDVLLDANASPRPGLIVIGGGGAVGALAGSMASRKLRPPLATVPANGQ